jgi:sodium-dependent dicarboxylate transporter 2/3/5
MIDAGMHGYFINTLLKRSKADLSTFISGMLFSSYFLSLFFANTVVVLTMLPIIKYILDGMHDHQLKGITATLLVLALIYGANIGGMGSLTGSALNLLYLGLIEFYKIPGRENITFFSWLIFGIPGTLVLIFLSRFILRQSEHPINSPITFDLPPMTAKPADLKKYLAFFILNIFLILTLTGIQFIMKPEKILQGLNSIDLCFIVYLVLTLFFAFIYPKGAKKTIYYWQNLLYLILTLFFFPCILVIELARDLKSRLKFPISEATIGRLDAWLLRTFNRIWQPFGAPPISSLKSQNRKVFVSINQLIYDLPFLGLIFMGIIILFVYLVSIFGDNPATPEVDGYILQFLEIVSLEIVPKSDQLFLFFLAINFIAIIFTQLINNTTVVIIMTPLLIKIAAQLHFSPLLFLLAITMAASAAFMTPLATPINAIAYAAIPGVSLKKMLKSGFLLILVSGLWITLLFYFVNKFIQTS